MKPRLEAIDEIRDLIEDINVAMLTTVDSNGDLHSRPMATQEYEFDGDVWFFAERTSNSVTDIMVSPQVNVSYSENGNFVSIAGDATIVEDDGKKRELWHPDLQVWFDGGPSSPDVVLIKIEGKSAQYWETPGNPIGKAIDMVKVLLTGETTAAGESRKVTF